jgi:LPS export ABC transporter protein LptC
MKKKAYAQNVEIKYFEDSKKYSLITADKAVLDTDTNFMEMTGNVNLKTSSGATLQTEKLFWDDVHKKMYSDEEVTIIKEGSILNGVGFESDVQMKDIVIKNKVKLKARNLKSGKIF